jgi:membrane protein DedA with SNARE-associated domain
MTSVVQSATALIQANSVVAGPLCLVVAFFGSFVGTNLIVPAGSFLTAMGVLAGAGVVSWTIGIWAACGASLGMAACYTLGLRLGAGARRLPMLRTRPELMQRAADLFEKYGFAAILIGYFSGPLRAPVACIAAVAGMNRLRFALANVSSALVWSAVALGVGAAPGVMIEPGSVWLLIAPVLVPALVVGLSAAIYYRRSRSGRSTAPPRSS